jgi:hypothetical protein
MQEGLIFCDQRPKLKVIRKRRIPVQTKLKLKLKLKLKFPPPKNAYLLNRLVEQKPSNQKLPGVNP